MKALSHATGSWPAPPSPRQRARAHQDTSAAQKEADRAAGLPSRPGRRPGGAEAALRAGQGTGGKKVIRLDALTVEGRIQKPQAFYMLQRSNLNFDELQRTESFVPKIDKSVDKDPF